MTFGDGKRKVLMLLDEYSSGGNRTEDRDLDLRMADFFDLAQQNIAGYKRIVRAFVPALPAGTAAAENPVACPAPGDFGQLFRVWRDGRLCTRYAWRGNAVLLPRADIGRVVTEYFALPAALPADTPDSYVFEVDEDAAACMPYYVAAQQLIVDLVVDPAPLLALYDRMRATLDTRLPTAGGGGICQRFYDTGDGGRLPWRGARA